MRRAHRPLGSSIPRTLALALALALALGLWPLAAGAGPWTRSPGNTYLQLSYSRIAAARIFSPDFSIQPLGASYEQHALGAYAEVGLIERWLTASFEGQLFRYNLLVDQGATYGLGDLRLGFWTGLVEKPLRLSAAMLLGIPSGDPSPSAGPGADAEGTLIARTLPTGDGEADVELRLSLGYSFGRARRWPLDHYLVAEAGYWFRTRGRSRDLQGNLVFSDFSDAFTYRAELGTKLPFRFLDRFWFIFRMAGLESFASSIEASRTCATGLGNGVTFNAYGFEVAARVWKGLGLSLGLDSAFRARCVAAGVNLKTGVSVEF